jgi:Ca2+-binding EF-hand superfamily protein
MNIPPIPEGAKLPARIFSRTSEGSGLKGKDGPKSKISTEKMDELMQVEEMKPRVKRKKRTALTMEQQEVIKKAFDLFDEDGSGSIEEKELQQVMKALGFQAKSAEVKEMMKELDEDKSGTIEFCEFLDKMKEKIVISRVGDNSNLTFPRS